MRSSELIAQMQADGHDAAEAMELLETFITSQKLHEEHREKILKEFGEGDG